MLIGEGNTEMFVAKLNGSGLDIVELEHETVFIEILHLAKAVNYKFVTVTPATHEVVIKRRPANSTSFRDIFGWNTHFLLENISSQLRAVISKSNFLENNKGEHKSPVRIATYQENLFLHSSFPTSAHDAVFFGPDTYRFLRFIQQTLDKNSWSPFEKTPVTCKILDVGCGSGAGGIIAAQALQNFTSTVVMNDINPVSIAYSKINARFAGVPITAVLGNAFTAVKGNFDVIISNPPFLSDDSERAYRHGGDNLGRALSVKLTKDAIGRLNPGGQFILYTGVVMLNEEDPFLAEIQPFLHASGYTWTYEEIDPDIFSEELERQIYSHAERIAAVGLVVTAN